MKKIISLIIAIMILVVPLVAQEVEKFDKPQVSEEIIKVNYQKKSAATAMALSALFPGAGQFYVNKRSISSYIFAAVEIGLFVAYLNYEKEGSDKEDEYMDYADKYYDRKRWVEVKNQLRDFDLDRPDNEKDMYNEDYFNLDEGKTQHYYEDIGKYDQYIFGWDDWYSEFTDNGTVIRWLWDGSGADAKWRGNENKDGEEIDPPYTAHRKVYIDMRGESRDAYDKADYCSFGLVLNHIISAIHAVKVTKNYNDDYISKVPAVEFNINSKVVNNKLTPMFMLSKRF